jgi:serine/threonine protein kinase
VRNIFLGANNTTKLGDFGQARFLQKGEDEWRLDKPSRLPVRYMPPETLMSKRFSLKSDVWAFAVAMWEIMTYVQIVNRSFYDYNHSMLLSISTIIDDDVS